MLAPARSLDHLAAAGAPRRGQLLLVTVLAILLAFATLVQTFFVIPNDRLFIRLFELIFAGIFLLASRRTFEAPVIRPSAAGWLFLGWLVSASISVALSEHLGPSLIRQAEWLTHFLFAVTLWSFLQHYELPFKVILLMIPLGFLLVGLHTLFTWISLPYPRDYKWFLSVPLVGHVRHFGYYALAGLLFSMCPLLGFGDKVSWRERLVALAALSVCWGFLFWTGGRAAVGTGILGLALITWLAGQGRRGWTAGVALVALGIGLWLSTYFWVNDPKLGFFASIERTATDATAAGVNGFTTGRLNIWREALGFLSGHIWFGIGPNSYRFMPIEAHGGIQPHSLLVQCLLDWGLLGTIPFLMLLALALWQGFVRLKQEHDPLRRTARITALALIVASTAHSLVDGLYYYAQPLLFLATCFAIILLPAGPRSAEAYGHPALSWLTAKPTLWALIALLAVLFIGNSDVIYTLF